MARGRLLKTKVKEAKKIAEAKALGYFQGKTKAHKKKPIEESLREHIGKMIDRIDPLEAAAVLSGTIIVHDIIFKTDEFVRSLQSWKDSTNKATEIIANLGILGFEGGLALDIVSTLFPDLAQKVYGEKPETTKATLDYQVVFWLLAYCISYYAFKHKTELLAAAKTFIGMI